MASPFSAAETTKVFKIFGIPQNGSAYVVGRIISLYGPGGNSYDFSAIVTQLNTLLGNITSTQYAECQTLLVEWDNINDYNEAAIYEDSGTKGSPIFDAQQRLKNVRMRLSNLIGFYVPEDGFFTDAAGVQWGGSGAPRAIR